MKEKNLVQKFRKFFYCELSAKEQESLWDIMCALRSEDGGDPVLKIYTTCRIRGALLGQNMDSFYGAIVMANHKNADKYCTPSRKKTRKEHNELYFNADSHWRSHFRSAIKALRRDGFASTISDLLKFLNR